MKTKFLIIALAIFSAIALTACFGQKEETPPQSKQQETNSDTILDNKLFEDAAVLNDASKCDIIKSAAKKEECKTVLTNFDLIGRAKDAKDKSLCGQIKLERYRTVCETDVDKAIAEEKEEETKQLTEQEAVEQQNPAICDKISDLNQQATCKFNAIINKAHEEKNPELCKQIGEADRIKQCVDFAS